MKFKRFITIVLSVTIILSLVVSPTVSASAHEKSNSTPICGDTNGSGAVTSDDAVYLLYSILFGTAEYPIIINTDFNCDGCVSSDDAIYLLYNTLMGDDEFPLSSDHLSKIAFVSKTYATVGQPIKIYLLNLTEYNSLDGLKFKVESNVDGVLYNDRWEYTPETTEDIKLNISVYNDKSKMLNRGSVTIKVTDNSVDNKLSVLVIGDSTINANTQTNAMLQLAKNEGVGLTLLGTRGSGLNRHEGRGGWTASNYVNSLNASSYSNPFYNPDKSKFDFAYYMDSQGYSEVDCVVIQLGINDIFSATTDQKLETKLETYFSNMEYIIDSIHAYDPDIKIVWNQVLPCSTDQSKFTAQYGTTQTAERQKRNSYLTNIKIIERYSDIKNVYISHSNTVLDTTANMGSGGYGAVHPSSDGYTAIGTQVYSFIRAIN